jgi:hypothetical protein
MGYVGRRAFGSSHASVTEQLIFENGQASLRPRAREYTNEIDKEVIYDFLEQFGQSPFLRIKKE